MRLGALLRTHGGLALMAALIAVLGFWAIGGPRPEPGGEEKAQPRRHPAPKRAALNAEAVTDLCRQRGLPVAPPPSPRPEALGHPGFPAPREPPTALGPASRGVLALRTRLDTIGQKAGRHAPLFLRAARGFAERFRFFAHLSTDEAKARAWFAAQKRRREAGSADEPAPAEPPTLPTAEGLASRAQGDRRAALAYYQELAENPRLRPFPELPAALLEYAELLLTPGHASGKRQPRSRNRPAPRSSTGMGPGMGSGMGPGRGPGMGPGMEPGSGERMRPGAKEGTEPTQTRASTAGATPPAAPSRTDEPTSDQPPRPRSLQLQLLAPYTQSRTERERALGALGQLVQEHPKSPEAVVAAAYLLTTFKGAERCRKVLSLVKDLPLASPDKERGTERDWLGRYVSYVAASCQLEEDQYDLALERLRAVLAEVGSPSPQLAPRFGALLREAALLLPVPDDASPEEARKLLSLAGKELQGQALGLLASRWIQKGRLRAAAALCETLDGAAHGPAPR